MDYNESQTVAFAYMASNIAGLILLRVAYKNTKLARLLFAILFALGELGESELTTPILKFIWSIVKHP